MASYVSVEKDKTEGSIKPYQEVIRLLLEAGARFQGNVETVKGLLKAGADVNAADKFGYTPFHYAAKEGQVEVINVLLKAGANPYAADKNGRTPLHYAAWKGHVKAAKVLLKAGAK